MATPSKVKSLDRAFSEFIRLRDSENGMFKCCSCSRTKPYEQAEAGHFINRRWKSIRWDERNVHAQCGECNINESGHPTGYRKFMIRQYGEEVVDELVRLKLVYHKFTDGELEILAKDYRKKVKSMKGRL